MRRRPPPSTLFPYTTLFRSRRLAGDRLEKPALRRQTLELRAGVGDRDEAVARAGLLEEVLGVRPGLQRRARLGCRDEERAVGRDAANRARVRGVERLERVDAEEALHHLRREARTTHPEQAHAVELDSREQLDELVHTLVHAKRLVEPAEPLRLVTAGPDARVAAPDPVDELRGARGH